MSPAALDLACAIARARIASAIQTAALWHSTQIALDFECAHQRARQRACTSLQRANAFTRTLKDHP